MLRQVEFFNITRNNLWVLRDGMSFHLAAPGRFPLLVPYLTLGGAVNNKVAPPLLNVSLRGPFSSALTL